MLPATAACTFSTSQFPKVVRAWCVLYLLTSKCASRHNGVQFLISHLASGLRTRRFSEPTFRPSRASNPIGKTHGVSRLCYLFAHLDLLSSDSFSFFFSSLLISSLLFSSLVFSSLALPISAFHFLSSLLFSSLPFPSLLFSSLTLPTSASHLSIVSEVGLLNFLRQLQLQLRYTNYTTQITLH